ncbi:MAG: TdeIII family type II restriction endonuclease, partial [Methanoculleus horonobensis]|nr:TdeIII family type II restriction endonuclease [Methanoculleus horonobensis]
MSDSKRMKAAIQQVVQELMDGVMERVLVSDPFVKEAHHSKKPLYAALIPDEIFKGSHFERRFVTPFGKVWEKLAVVAATEGLGYGTMGHRIDGCVREDRLHRIAEILNRLEHSPNRKDRIKPDWAAELAYITAGKGELIPVSVIC